MGTKHWFLTFVFSFYVLSLGIGIHECHMCRRNSFPYRVTRWCPCHSRHTLYVIITFIARREWWMVLLSDIIIYTRQFSLRTIVLSLPAYLYLTFQPFYSIELSIYALQSHNFFNEANAYSKVVLTKTEISNLLHTTPFWNIIFITSCL